MLNLDTHILLHALAGKLRPTETALLRGDSWSISSIVLWEVSKLAELGRIEVDLDDPELTRAVSKVHTWPITLDVCRAIRGLDFRGDPADEIIAATSVVHGVPLVTRDRDMRRSRRVPIARLGHWAFLFVPEESCRIPMVPDAVLEHEPSHYLLMRWPIA